MEEILVLFGIVAGIIFSLWMVRNDRDGIYSLPLIWFVMSILAVFVVETIKWMLILAK